MITRTEKNGHRLLGLFPDHGPYRLITRSPEGCVTVERWTMVRPQGFAGSSRITTVLDQEVPSFPAEVFDAFWRVLEEAMVEA